MSSSFKLKVSLFAAGALLSAVAFAQSAAEVQEPAPEPAKPAVQAEARETKAIESPLLRGDLEVQAWELVRKYTEKYDIPEKAHMLFRVIRTESNCRPQAVSKGKRYLGICQFTQRTFDHAVAGMKREGIFMAADEISPFDPDHAIQVMAWMWCQGMERHWGPVRRMNKKITTDEICGRGSRHHKAKKGAKELTLKKPSPAEVGSKPGAQPIPAELTATP